MDGTPWWKELTGGCSVAPWCPARGGFPSGRGPERPRAPLSDGRLGIGGALGVVRRAFCFLLCCFYSIDSDMMLDGGVLHNVVVLHNAGEPPRTHLRTQ